MTTVRTRVALPKSASSGAERCSVLGTLGVVGDFWALSILRCAVYGMRRFGEFERELGIATNVLADRLARLVDAGLLDKVSYQAKPLRHEYTLTEAGRELTPVILALKMWGDKHLQPEGAWTMVRHQGCSTPLEVAVLCRDCGATPSLDDTETVFLRDAPEAAVPPAD